MIDHHSFLSFVLSLFMILVHDVFFVYKENTTSLHTSKVMQWTKSSVSAVPPLLTQNFESSYFDNALDDSKERLR